MKLKSPTLFIAFLVSQTVWAHGENKAGPHGGLIRMPGAYHTEVVPSPAGHTFQVYLLDIEWKNPTTQKSKLDAFIVQGDTQAVIPCESKKTFYECRLPEGRTLNQGQLRIQSTREGQTGGPALYSLPLKLGK